MPAGEFDEDYLPPSLADLEGPDLDEEVRFGSACRGIIESEAYKRVLDQMQAAIVAGFKAAPLRDTEGLVYLRTMQKCLDDMHAIFTEAAVTGRMAQEELDKRLTALREEYTEAQI